MGSVRLVNYASLVPTFFFTIFRRLKSHQTAFIWNTLLIPVVLFCLTPIFCRRYLFCLIRWCFPSLFLGTSRKQCLKPPIVFKKWLQEIIFVKLERVYTPKWNFFVAKWDISGIVRYAGRERWTSSWFVSIDRSDHVLISVHRLVFLFWGQKDIENTS